MDIERRIEEMGLSLPPPVGRPAGLDIPFAWVRVHGHRAYVSGHGPLGTDGSPTGPFGKVPTQVSLEEAQHAARLSGLAVLASLRAALGDLDRIGAWLMVNGYVNAVPNFGGTTAVLNPFSDLILDVFGAERGAHARTAIGVTSLPLDLPVVVSAELELDDVS